MTEGRRTGQTGEPAASPHDVGDSPIGLGLPTAAMQWGMRPVFAEHRLY